MDPKYYALVELTFTGAVVLGFCFWQLRSVNRELREDRKKQQDRAPSDTEQKPRRMPGASHTSAS